MPNAIILNQDSLISMIENLYANYFFNQMFQIKPKTIYHEAKQIFISIGVDANRHNLYFLQ